MFFERGKLFKLCNPHYKDALEICKCKVVQERDRNLLSWPLNLGHLTLQKSGGLCLQHTNSESQELVTKIRWLCLQHTNSRTRDENQAALFTTHEIKKSGIRVKNQAAVFATYKRRNTRTYDNKKKMQRLC